jgi:hypothetical protein
MVKLSKLTMMEYVELMTSGNPYQIINYSCQNVRFLSFCLLIAIPNVLLVVNNVKWEISTEHPAIFSKQNASSSAILRCNYVCFYILKIFLKKFKFFFK